MEYKTKSGFVAIVGRPNVGKSTLLNQIMGEKIAITSNKPQTTRHKISGILTKDDYQIVFVDTPGMHKGQDLLNRQIDKMAVSTLNEVDAIIFVTDKERGLAEDHIVNYFRNVKIPVFLVINKIDLLTRSNRTEKTNVNHQIDKIILSYLNDYNYEGVYPISALNNTNINFLLQDVKKTLTPGPFYYPEDMITDQSDKTVMAEFIREKILFHTEQEVPHATAVIIETLEVNDKQKTLDVSALIIVERQTQKLILIGKDGSVLKKIGTEARRDINKRFNTKVHLELWIKVQKDWRNKATDIARFGYSDE